MFKVGWLREKSRYINYRVRSKMDMTIVFNGLYKTKSFRPLKPVRLS